MKKVTKIQLKLENSILDKVRELELTDYEAMQSMNALYEYFKNEYRRNKKVTAL